MTTFNLSSINSNLQRIIHHIWDPEPRNETPMEPIYLLGVEYRAAPAGAATADPPASEWPQDFLDDFASRIWLTYRSSFAPIPRSPTTPLPVLTRLRSSLPEHAPGFTSDEGWGCMIRSAQSVLANTLSILHFSRSWRRGHPHTPAAAAVPSDRHLLALFADDPAAPFSIHRFVDYGARFAETEKGQWFGPQAAATTIERLVADGPALGLAVYVSKQDTVYLPALLRAAYAADHGRFTPTLVLVPTRLGINGVTQVYWESLKNTLKMRQSVGIAGGRPRSSHYFLGVQDGRFIYMDPHVTRPALRAGAEAAGELDLDSCYTTRLRMLRVQDMDPSMMIAFLIRDEEELREWREAVRGKEGGKAVVNVVDGEVAGERESALDEVESFTDDEEGLA